jgi:hypothetical protein
VLKELRRGCAACSRRFSIVPRVDHGWRAWCARRDRADRGLEGGKISGARPFDTLMTSSRVIPCPARGEGEGRATENGSLLGRDGSGASPVFRAGADRQNYPEILRYAAEPREAACSRSVQDAVFLRANNPLRRGCRPRSPIGKVFQFSTEVFGRRRAGAKHEHRSGRGGRRLSCGQCTGPDGVVFVSWTTASLIRRQTATPF